ncbi:flagellar biosynthetic protein FliO [Rehaibacterium terrae]|jgi:flagellar protein FliO/FliZ|uniref:Flagellar protein n=1 Tax=Rehaibacterium terrae TaxID=1341696 RepID=A0A7W7Y252_9GAMM|nr:flagellar biosynthetic protein FliO [Rehaibacterium terrae]MBB5016719.1 flagellar protein FliO/FliZ [Rehaibacterium terrae]
MSAVASAAPAAAPFSTASTLGGTVMALLIVVAVILALGWLLRRLPGATVRGHGPLRVVAALPVGVKERVLLVAVGERQLLIGVTAQQITLLQTLDTPLPVEAAPESFAALLGKRLGQGGGR